MRPIIRECSTALKRFGQLALQHQEPAPLPISDALSLPLHVDGHRMRTIAVVEDDPSMLQSLSRLLSAYGFRVDKFASAELFLAGIAECDAICLVLDIHLGGISGIDLKRKLNSSGRSLPVIFMTAVDNEATREQALEAGCIAYLRKPFMAKSLIQAINGAA
jgi:FixJ family two-component response regulator